MFSKIPLFNKPKTSLKLESQGFTLVESLMGIVVITVVAIAITPPIVISTATRVQNRRAEQAMQLAQAEIDRIRVFVEQGGAYMAKLPPIHSGTVANGVISRVAAPTRIVPFNSVGGINANRASADSSSKAFGVDVNSDAEVDYYVQIFRDDNANARVANTTSLSTFQMGVRVYSAAAEDAAEAGILQTDVASLRLTNSSGGQQFKPLAVIYTTIASSDNATTSFERYRDYLR